MIQRPARLGPAIAAPALAALVAALPPTATAHAPPAVNAAPLSPPSPIAPGSFAKVVAQVGPAVVSIDVEGRPSPAPARGGAPGLDGPFGELRRLFPQLPFRAPPARRGVASGFFISADGYVVTNNHVVADAGAVTVRTTDGRALAARVVGRDPETDLAVLKVDGAGFPFIALKDGARPRVGDWVVAVGNPFNLGGTATAGIVSAIGRPNVSGSSYVDYLQIDAAINRGNSGGPTFDVHGRIVGVNSAIFSPSGGSVGIGFAIPAEVAARVSRQLVADGKVTRGYIGATVQDVTPAIAESLGLGRRGGALVADVVTGGPAETAGLKSGDVILGLGEAEVRSAGDLTRRIARARPGEPLRLQLQRAGKPLQIGLQAGVRPGRAAAGARPHAGTAAVLGLHVTAAHGGLRLIRVDPASDAARRGLRAGDILEAVNGQALRQPADLTEAVSAARRAGREAVLIRASRGGRNFFVPLEVGAGDG